MRLHHKLRRKFSDPPPPPISFQNHSVFKENVKNMSHIEFMYNLTGLNLLWCLIYIMRVSDI